MVVGGGHSWQSVQVGLLGRAGLVAPSPSRWGLGQVRRAGSREGPASDWWKGEGISGVSSSRATEPTRGPHGLNLGVNFGEMQICCPK